MMAAIASGRVAEILDTITVRYRCSLRRYWTSGQDGLR